MNAFDLSATICFEIIWSKMRTRCVIFVWFDHFQCDCTLNAKCHRRIHTIQAFAFGILHSRNSKTININETLYECMSGSINYSKPDRIVLTLSLSKSYAIWIYGIIFPLILTNHNLCNYETFSWFVWNCNNSKLLLNCLNQIHVDLLVSMKTSNL